MNDKFPKYLTQSTFDKKKQFVDIYTAANRQRDWFAPWNILDDVLEDDRTVRRITRDEINEINNLADEIDASK